MIHDLEKSSQMINNLKDIVVSYLEFLSDKLTSFFNIFKNFLNGFFTQNNFENYISTIIIILTIYFIVKILRGVE